ncbi:MAG: ABC transporter permease [Clostridia bacterium]|nr:ABC transporter permease [Clostridia bacterium]
MRSVFADIWSSLKKSPFLFLFLFVQIVITSLILYISIANYYWTEEANNTANIAWGNKEYYKLYNPVVMDDSDMEELFSFIWTPSYYTYMMNPDTYDFYYSFLKKVEDLTERLEEIDGLTVMPVKTSYTTLLEERNWSEEDKKYGEFDMFEQNTPSVKDENGNIRYVRLKTLYVDSKYFEYYNTKVSEGRLFEKNDFLYDDEYVPVIMGSKYKKYFSLGEEFEIQSRFGKTKNKVIGFIAENQYYTHPNGVGWVFSYDSIIIKPIIERKADEILENEEYLPYLGQLGAVIDQAFLLIEPEKQDEVVSEIENLLDEFELSDYVRLFHLRIDKEIVSNYNDQLVIGIVACVLTLIFSLFSFIFTMLYKIDNNIKNYAIRMVVGETYTGISLRYIFESLIVFFLGQATGLFLFRIYAVYSYIYQGYNSLETATLRTGIILNIIFCIVSAVILYLCVSVKLRSYSLATLIRGNEVRKEKHLPFYRVVIFLMLAVVGVFAMFIASYRVLLDRIDIYYNSYYTKNVKIAYVLKKSGDDAPEVTVNCDEITGNVGDSVINKYIDMFYKGDDYIEERGLYFNGYIDPVNMLYGRFFTSEESAGKEKIAVVGKGIYEKYVTFNEAGEPVYHSDALDADLLVTGVMGKEEADTSIDFTVFTPIKVATAKSASGSYTLDGKDKATVEKLTEEFEKYVSETAEINTRDYKPRITVEAPTDMLLMLLALIVINAMVFCFYYVSKQRNIHYVKKLVGYSKIMILADTLIDFLVLTACAFIFGNAVTVLLKETVFAGAGLFSIYILDFQAVLIAFAAVALLTVVLTVIAVARTFASANNNEYRV